MARERLAANDSEASLLDRRSYLKLAGSAVAAVGATSGMGSAQTDAGYGAGGYGQVPYGGGEADATDSTPTIDEFTVSSSERLGEDRMFSVRWAASDPAEDLDTVEVVVAKTSSDVNFEVTDVTGGSASGWELFQFPVGSSIDVTIRAKDEAGSVSKESKSISL
ncbi:hypothetical protein [Halorussus litoreus]|uniref:hypothetical protein n=1 Tax=Halorussus litoreus TaxID=1710536 RepID=UPI001300B9C3|nr:hypothetical protein [Halorussus litoreus]